MAGEAVGVLKNTTANHEAVYLWVLSVEFESMSFIADVAVDD